MTTGITLDAVILDIGRCGAQNRRIVSHLPDSCVAHHAEQSADLSGSVAMIDVERTDRQSTVRHIFDGRQTDWASVVLCLKHFLDVFLRETIRAKASLFACLKIPSGVFPAGLPRASARYVANVLSVFIRPFSVVDAGTLKAPDRQPVSRQFVLAKSISVFANATGSAQAPVRVRERELRLFGMNLPPLFVLRIVSGFNFLRMHCRVSLGRSCPAPLAGFGDAVGFPCGLSKGRHDLACFAGFAEAHDVGRVHLAGDTA